MAAGFRRPDRGRTAGPPAGMGTVGWLFADMMIGLFVIALATQAAPTVTGRDFRPPAAPIASAGTSTPDARMEQAALVRSIEVDHADLVRGRKAAKRATREAIHEAVADLEADGRRAALVLVWGHAPEVDLGMAIADAAEAELKAASEEVFAGAIAREFWHGGKAGTVVLEIYLFGQSP